MAQHRFKIAGSELQSFQHDGSKGCGNFPTDRYYDENKGKEVTGDDLKDLKEILHRALEEVRHYYYKE